MKTNQILCGDALTKLKELDDQSVNCVMTSPPYWALRDYGEGNSQIWDGEEGCEHKWGADIPASGSRSNDNSNKKRKEVFGKRDGWNNSNFCLCGAWKGQLGLEPTFDLYIKHLCDIFEETKRVLRDDGTCWVNLGDTYIGGGGGGNSHETNMKNRPEFIEANKIQSKSLTLIPMRFAIEMVNRGWILRNTIIWHKPNCMPSSVKDRFTVDFEYLFFFVKKKKYYFETQYEPLLTNENRPDGVVRSREYNYNSKENKNPKAYLKQDNVPSKNSRLYEGFNKRYEKPTQGRNKRAVWRICPKPFKEAHFAVYPEELCETPIKAGCPEFVCVKCGNPKYPRYIPSKKYEKLLKSQRRTEAYTSERRKKAIEVGNAFGSKKVTALPDYKVSFEPTCNCNAEFTGGIILDPFFGAGTTGLVALKQNKKFIGIELNPSYIQIIKKRLKPYLEQTKLTDKVGKKNK